MRRPGWIAAARARHGIGHRHGRVGIGYRSALETVSLSRRELGHHGAVFGAPGSGKTTLLSLLVQGHASIGPCIVIDAKGSRAMQEAIAAAGGLVWTIGGRLKLDLLDPDPTVLAEQLTEAARHEGPAEVFSEAAARACQWIGHLLRWEATPPTLEAVEALLNPTMLAAALKRNQRRPRVPIWQAELAAASVTELSGMATALMRVTRLLDSAAGPSLGAGIDAARFEDVVQGKTTLLVSLDSRRYPSLARIIGAWALVALQRACTAVPVGTSCLLVVDEVGALGKHARHLEPLLARARDAGVGVVVAAHGLSQLEAAVHGLGNQVLQETAWQVILAQGDPDDADALSRLFPLKVPRSENDHRINNVTLGKFASGTPTVMRDDLMWLGTGECAYRVRPVDRMDGRWGMARIALPYVLEVNVKVLAEGPAEEPAVEMEPTAEGNGGTEPEEDLRGMVYRHVKVKDGWRTWVGNFDVDGYPRVWVPTRRKYEQAHRLICEWEHGVMQKGWTVDHVCDIKACVDHLEACTRAENLRRRHARERGELPTGHAQYADVAP